MSDLGRGFDNQHPLASLPRAWWFPQIPGYRSNVRATYVRYDLAGVSDDHGSLTPDRDLT